MTEITIYPPEQFPTLMKVIRFMESPNTASGLCFHRSAALLMDLSWGHLCVGTLEGDPVAAAQDPLNSPTPFIHGWVEQGDTLFAPTTIDQMQGLAAFPREHYYARNGVRDVRSINRNALKKLALQHGWNKRDRFGEGRGETSLGRVLLDHMGVPYAVSGRGGVVPPEYATAKEIEA